MRFFKLMPLLAVFSGAAFAGPLTFDEALIRAENQAPSLSARALDISARRSTARAAGELPDPRLGIAIENFPVSGPPAFTYTRDEMTMARLGISQDVPNLAKRRARTRAAEADIDVAEAERAAEARRVRVAAAIAWIDLAYAQRRLAAIDSAISRLSALAPMSTAGTASGTSRPAQALDVRRAIADLADRRSEIAADIARTKALLARWTGDPEPEVEGALPDFEVDPTTLRSAIGDNPALLVAIARAKQAEAGVTIARADKRPDWSFDLTYGKRAGRYGDMVSLGTTISLPLFARKRQDPRIDASIANASAAADEQEDIRRAIAADLDAALADHVMHHEQWMRSRATLLPLARQRADLETASYGAGRATLIDIAQAQSTLADAELETLDREAAVARDAVRLVLTYGKERP